MKRIIPIIGLSCAIVVASAQIDPKRIIPGKQLGKMKIGDFIEDMKWLKKPDFGDTSSGHQWQTWEAKKPDPRNGKIINSLDVYTSVNPDGKYQIKLIRATSPTFATSDKMMVGSPLSDVKRRYPKILKTAEYVSPQFSGKVALYDDIATGIAFEVKIEGEGQGSKREKCLSVWVHDPGMDPLKEYYSPVQYLTSKPDLKKAAKFKEK